MKKVTQKTNITKYVILCIVFIILLIVGIFITIKGFKSFKTKKLFYTQDCDLDYKVHLKPNAYFDTDVLGKDKTYITTLIENIEAFYNYRVTFSETVSGEYSYYVTATMQAEKDMKTYWTKEYTILEEQTGTFKNYKTLTLSQSLPIDYNQYNDLMNEFGKEFKLGTDGNLEVVLHLTAKVNNKNFDSAKINSNIKMDIPLSKQAVEASINTSNINGTKSVTAVEKLTDKPYGLYKLDGAILILLSCVMIIFCVIKIVICKNSSNVYEKSIKKILNGYDSIIVKIDHILDFTNLNIIKVSKFNDLIDVHNEIRMPINFFEDKKNAQSLFLLINNDMAWIYILQSSKIDKKFKL